MMYGKLLYYWEFTGPSKTLCREEPKFLVGVEGEQVSSATKYYLRHTILRFHRYNICVHPSPRSRLQYHEFSPLLVDRAENQRAPPSDRRRPARGVQMRSSYYLHIISSRCLVVGGARAAAAAGERVYTRPEFGKNNFPSEQTTNTRDKQFIYVACLRFRIYTPEVAVCTNQ